MEPGPGSVPRTYLRRASPYGPGEPGIDPGRIRAFFKRRYRTMALGFVSVMAAVTVVTFLLPRTYESSASFLVEQEQRPSSQAPALDVLERMGQVASRETEMALVRSRRVVEPVVDLGDLHVSIRLNGEDLRPSDLFTAFEARSDAVEGSYEVYRDLDERLLARDATTGEVLAMARLDRPLGFANLKVGPLRPGVARGLGTGDGGAAIEIQVIPFSEAVSQTQERLEVAAVQRDADLVEMTCSGKTPAGAQWLCTEVGESYLDLRAELQNAEATAAADFLSDQAERVRIRLSAAEDSLRVYAQQRQAVALEARAAEEVRQNAALWAEREQLIAERASLLALTRQIESREGSGTRRYRDFASFPTFLKNQNQVVTELVASLVELDNRRNDLAIRRTEEDVELAALDARIAAIENQLRAVAEGYAQALGAQITSLDRALDNSRDVLASIPSRQIETARLERQINLLDDLYTFLQTRLQEAQIAQAVKLPSVRVVDQASLPFKPSSPNRRLNLALGFLLASSFGLMAGLWREYSDTRIRERRTVEEETGIPVLGMVPAMKRPGPVISMKLASSNGSEVATFSPPWNQERAMALEAFRNLATDLAFVGRRLGPDGLHTVAVTSSTRGEGKTLVATNLAIARASHGSRTLLVDADLKGRGLTKLLRIPGDSRGLTELLTASGEVGEVTQHIRVFEVGARSALYVLPAGEGSTRSAELLESRRFRELMNELRGHFELLVVDTPPLNVLADAAAATSHADGVVLVVRGGFTDRDSLELSLDRLGRIGAKTAGIVLNDADLSSSHKVYNYGD